MGKLTFSMFVSVDGYINGPDGKFGWAAPDMEVHAFANAEEAKHRAAIYGRRMYETMVYWETADQQPGANQIEIDFAKAWQALHKVVVSKSLPNVSSGRTTLCREFTADDVRALKADMPGDISVSGPTIGSSFLNQGLVDEVALYSVPFVVGGGTPMFQGVTAPLKLDKTETHAFANGTTFVRYAVRN